MMMALENNKEFLTSTIGNWYSKRKDLNNPVHEWWVPK